MVRNHTEALAVDVAHGRVHGVLLRDQITGRDSAWRRGWVINCSGPWADRVCQRSSIRMDKPMLGGVRGSHIVVPRFPGSPNMAVYTEARGWSSDFHPAVERPDYGGNHGSG